MPPAAPMMPVITPVFALPAMRHQLESRAVAEAETQIQRGQQQLAPPASGGIKAAKPKLHSAIASSSTSSTLTPDRRSARSPPTGRTMAPVKERPAMIRPASTFDRSYWVVSSRVT